MKQSLNKRTILIAFLVVALAVAVLLSIPKVRTYLFVQLYHETIEDSLSYSMGVPADDAVLFGYEYVNTWEGEHSMTEFVISASGFGSETKYYGCYFSYDDVPLAFQNLNTTLVKNEDSWTWVGKGDNCGSTTKIMDKWYYFETSF